jgi:hypothetical protein
VVEGARVLAAAQREGVPLRLLGGVAVALRAPGGLPPTLARSYGDLDFVTSRAGLKRVQQLFRELAYTPHVSFNALNSKERLLFFDERNDRQVDIFVGSFRMCHEIQLDGRLEVDHTSIPLAELLLTKLQVVELNEKDVRDTVALLHEREVAERDGEALNGHQVARLCAGDWGLWRTITRNLAACASRVRDYEVDHAGIAQRFDELQQRIEREPKSRAWRLRARVGERKRWYELPEERA